MTLFKRITNAIWGSTPVEAPIDVAASTPNLTVTELPKKPSPTSGRRKTPAEWVEMVRLWEAGNDTLETIGARFNISAPGLWEGLKKRGAVKGAALKPAVVFRYPTPAVIAPVKPVQAELALPAPAKKAPVKKKPKVVKKKFGYLNLARKQEALMMIRERKTPAQIAERWNLNPTILEDYLMSKGAL